ncbi:MAG: hypothetical protein JJ863_16305 [Deltaproteobacteria bacterium]|nr:hypothetical protein [Deltaproteobacteria bacterium]
MTTIHRTGHQANLTLRDTEPRVTPEPPSRRFAETLGEGAHALLAGVEQAAGLLPGGTAVAAAIRSTGDSGSSAGAPAGTTGAAAGQAQGGALRQSIDSSASTAEQLLALQQEISMEQRVFQTTSNVLKARHDTAKAVIQNVR